MVFAKALLPVDLHQDADEIKTRGKFIQQLGTVYCQILHVAGFGSLLRAKQCLLNCANQLHEIGLQAEWALQEGIPAKTITNFAQTKQCDYIYIPSRRTNALYRTLLGSTAREVVRVTEVPVFIHKQHPPYWQPASLRTVLLATDFGPAVQRALPYAQALGAPDRHLTILHVGQRSADPHAEKRRQEQIQKGLDILTGLAKPHFASLITRTGVGSPARRILAEKADVIVLGRLNKRPLGDFLGSTAEEVTQESRCSILLVP